jgi:hypothetical protein
MTISVRNVTGLSPDYSLRVPELSPVDGCPCLNRANVILDADERTAPLPPLETRLANCYEVEGSGAEWVC